MRVWRLEVVTIDSSTDTELEDESEIVRLLQKFLEIDQKPERLLSHYTS